MILHLFKNPNFFVTLPAIILERLSGWTRDCPKSRKSRWKNAPKMNCPTDGRRLTIRRTGRTTSITSIAKRSTRIRSRRRRKAAAEPTRLELAVRRLHPQRAAYPPLAMPAAPIPGTVPTPVWRNNNSNNNRTRAEEEDTMATTNHRLHYPNAPIVSPD